MTTKTKSTASLIATIITSSGVLVLIVYGFISYGRISTKVENTERVQKDQQSRIEWIEERKADKEMVIEMREDLRYIRARIDEHMAKDKK